MIKPEITWNDFQKLDIRTGTIVHAADFPGLRNPAYQLQIDFGTLGIKNSSAQITDLYTKEDLKGKQILAVVNFPPKKIINFYSECLVLGVYGLDKEVTLLTIDKEVGNGFSVG